MLYERLPEQKVRCNLCGRRCIIPSGKTGICAARKNEEGTLFSLSYSRACSIAIDPIEKKPLFHFNPGSQVLSIASPFCNFFCSFCCNWIISQQRSTIQTQEISPKGVVNAAKRLLCEGISYTYTEPTTFFEWAYETAKLAQKNALFNTFVTNGYLTPEAIEIIAPFLDAATVDFKGAGDPRFYREIMRVPSVDPIYDCLRSMKRKKIHIEITNLIVPEYGESEEKLKALAQWIVSNLGEDTPIHLLRFHPSAEFMVIRETPISTIERAVKLVSDVGLRYVYSGNIPNHKGENTYCPNCNKLLVERDGFKISKWEIDADLACPRCRAKIAIKKLIAD